MIKFYQYPVTLTNGPYGTKAALRQLRQEYTDQNPNFLTTHSGKTLKDFDLVEGEGAHFFPKNNLMGNGTIDAIAIVWRNNNFINRFSCLEGAALQDNWGFGVNEFLTQQNPADPITYIPNLVGSWIDCTGTGNILINEFVHTIYGGNNWHASGGAGRHTFPFIPSVISINGQPPAVSTGVCGWDRMFTSWHSSVYQDPSDIYRIPVLDENLNHISGDLITPTPNEQIFILRDHYTTGDAIRIKLPHLNWQNTGDIKNQYLWIENRQLIKEFDVQQYEYLDCVEDWTPGIYSYVQVGKDILSSDDIDDLAPSSSSYSVPNGLASWLFSVSAEGNFDYKYRTDLSGTEVATENCAGGDYIPKETDSPETLSNPFTGASDLYKTKFDSNNDGVLGKSDNFDIGGAEIKNSTLEFNLSESGDGEDAFRLGGNSKIGIGRNPSAMPVYTRGSISKPEDFDPVINPMPGIESYENRIIWLNGVSIEIIEEIWNNDLQAFDTKVRVRWNDFEVDRNTRWCGDIVLQQDVNANFQSQLIVGNSRVITLDQGKSPTDYQGIAQSDGSFLFAEPTVLTIKDGTKLEMKDLSNITIKNNSTMVIEEGAEVVMKNGACIVVEDSGVLELRGNDITMMGEDALILIKNGGTLRTADGVDFTFNIEDDIVDGVIVNEAGGYIAFEAGNIVELGEDSDFVIERDFAFGATDKRFIQLYEDATLALIDGHSLKLKYGKILYEKNSRILITNQAAQTDESIELYGVNMTYNGVTSSSNGVVGIEAEGLDLFSAKYVNSNGLSHTFKLNAKNGVIRTSSFTTNDIGISATNFEYITLYRNDFRNIDGTSVELSNIDFAVLDLNTIGEPPSNINYSAYGVDLKQVGFANISNGYIKDCTTGILSEGSNVFLRNGAVIEDNIVGVDFGDTSLPDFALTVGDIGCASIINNDVGVRGENIILNIDAIEHAANNGGTPPRANRFDGNTTLFDICYTAPSIVNDNPTILMKGNYWGGGSFWSNTSLFKIDLAFGSPACGTTVNIDDSEFVTIIPYGCDLIMSQTPQTPTPTKVKCELKNSNDENILVHEQARLAFVDLAQENFTDAKSKYQPIADLSSQEVNYEAACLHKIYFARCMTEGLGDDVNSFIAILPNEDNGWEEGVIDYIKPPIENFTIFPNPANDFIFIQNKQSVEFEIVIYNTFGQQVFTSEFTKELNLDVGSFDTGIYILDILDKSSKERIQKKIVIQ